MTSIDQILFDIIDLVSMVQDEQDPMKNDIVDEYKKHNAGNGRSVCFIGYFIDSRTTIYANTKDGEDVSDQYLRNLNVTSPYRYRIDKSGILRCNVFIDKRFLGKDYKKLENNEAKKYINNLLGVAINLISYHYPQLEIDHRNMYGIVVTVSVLLRKGFPMTPQFLADALGTNETVIDAVLSKYTSSDNIHGLPWYL